MSVDVSKFPPLSVTGIGLVDGLLGANCRHSIGPGDGRFNPYEGLYDSEENRKREQLEQKQRAMERSIRGTKREVQGLKAALDAATDPADRAELQEQYQKKAAKLTEQNKAYDAYCKENDLKPLRERLQIAGWDRQQAAQAAAAGRKANTPQTLENSGERGTIGLKGFNTKYDPMHEAMGSAEESHPDEIKRLESHLSDMGVVIEHPASEKLEYQPSLFPGRPGTIFISKGASYSAWLHEVKHADDDMADGWMGMRVFRDPEKCIKREVDAYQIEIDMAHNIGREDLVKRLEVLRDAEIGQYTREER